MECLSQVDINLFDQVMKLSMMGAFDKQNLKSVVDDFTQENLECVMSYDDVNIYQSSQID